MAQVRAVDIEHPFAEGPLVCIFPFLTSDAYDEPAREATAEECLEAARLALEHAVANDAGVMQRCDEPVCRTLNPLRPAFWAALKHYVKGNPKEPRGLQRLINREADLRLAERLMVSRQAARQVGFDDVKHLVRALAAIASEPDVTTRAAALADHAGDQGTGGRGVIALRARSAPKLGLNVAIM